ncbi:BsuPI-related putative proteinase inhibitor [Bacillus sp. T33-2]|uniref:BsuPI-related putative proteinase inhibitor n=1 Tax=Bacillus sp. T33-2 TaxID=2054168 RepID=UPI0015E0AEFB|nr:BsuPI-related putative proteinase inhibitor [Bacillus sp. T33-2]
MKKLLLSILLLGFAITSVFAMGEERPVPVKEEIIFIVDPIAGPDKAQFDLTLRSDGQNSIELQFPTSQRYEIVVKDETGNRVFQFSEGKAFAQVLGSLTLRPGEDITWKEEWDYIQGGTRLKQGEYTVYAELKASMANGKPMKKLTDVKKMHIPAANPFFRNVKSEGEKGTYKVTGEARPEAGAIYFTVEDGHNEQIQEAEVKVATQAGWSPFTIQLTIPEDKLPQNGTLMFNLYERSKENGKIIHTYPVVLERFY